ncbi:MAG: sigma-70 family RNA polymerase sigma factor [Tannerellaceae bacterium]|jgi:RNA polymerase sigma-70 factor (ECF subfamily)|nr:sigma-70 family RNA polymerase sigma factor [Tannerellaceae bacterium]
MIGKEAFKELFDKHFDGVRRFIFYRCGDTEVASDMAQEVFMKVWEKRGQLHDEKLKSLVYKMAKDSVIGNYRKGVCRMHFEQNMMQEGGEAGESPEEEMMFVEMASLYARALEEMPEGQRVVFLMSRNEGLKYQEIAECLGISVKAVEKRMGGALQFLKKVLLAK